MVRGRLPGVSVDGVPGSSQVICNRVPRQKPSSGIAGEDCSQPPDGVADTMLPQRSTTSIWQVSPRVSPVGVTVGSPTPRPAAEASPASAGGVYSVRSGGKYGSRPGTVPGRKSWDARSVISARRLAQYSSDKR